jgi:deoxyribodipyrimidine photo-lyase
MTTLVWFKRDLRIADHAPLAEAANGPCVCLYVYEPELIGAPDFDASHLAFANGALTELAGNLERLGSGLVTRSGNAVEVLDRLHHELGFERMVSHQETGNWLSFQRDKAVRRWARDKGVHWDEFPQDGVIRALKSRDGWARKWDASMRSPLVDAPSELHSPSTVASEGTLGPKVWGLSPFELGGIPCGERAALDTLESFLVERGERYQSEMSSPLTAESSCSRMSPHLAYGTVSRRTVFQTFERRRDEVRAARKAKTGISAHWPKAMSSFNKRLHWNGHFIQRLELQPELEFTNMSRAMDGLREDDFNQEWFEAWCEGRTGYPMVDACMRYLREYRWLNFRMRAMLTSFASYHLWLDWRRTGAFLARNFLDYEPGIHYSQIQMQSGTTGINSVRIYSPIKQAKDHDPEGEFIRRWVPELQGVPPKFIAEPHTMTADDQSRFGCVIGQQYPAPLVDHKTAVQQAKNRVYAARRKEGAREEANAIYDRHGSRKKTRERNGR